MHQPAVTVDGDQVHILAATVQLGAVLDLHVAQLEAIAHALFERLVQVFTQAGLNVRLGTLDDTITEPTELALADGSTLTLEPLVRTKRRLGLKHFDPCTILLNNDLSAGIPDVLKDLHEQYLLPPLHAGWAVRRKSQHFESYEEVAKKFAKLLGMDPWLINPLFARCGDQ